jgi:hypothetical protein
VVHGDSSNYIANCLSYGESHCGAFELADGRTDCETQCGSNCGSLGSSFCCTDECHTFPDCKYYILTNECNTLTHSNSYVGTHQRHQCDPSAHRAPNVSTNEFHTFAHSTSYGSANKRNVFTNFRTYGFFKYKPNKGTHCFADC